uniref:Uncharacterized protein n=1 Tax=Leersia perrieri TaxID=77586 RepID=A0A0D9VAK4_9ORYZ
MPDKQSHGTADSDRQRDDGDGGDDGKGGIEQGPESAGDIQALLDMDKDAISKKIRFYISQLYTGVPNDYDLWPEDSESDEPEDPLTELYERIAFYRIIGYEVLSKGRKLGEQDIAKLKEEYTPSILRDEGYFERYERSLEWYFCPKLCEFPATYDDYQRLMLQNNLVVAIMILEQTGDSTGILYLDWERYRTTGKSYEADLAYVRYCEVIANELKWIEDHLARGPTQAEWRRLKDVTLMLALKIATSSQGIDTGSAFTASQGYLWSIQFDFSYKDFDGVYFEIWKRVAKRKMHFVDALTEVYREDMYPVRKVDIKYELDKIPLRFRTMKEIYDAHVACIDETVPEDEARQLIKEAAKKMYPKPMIYLDYARKKLEISKAIGLIT